jgi:hypothetical protein
MSHLSAVILTVISSNLGFAYMGLHLLLFRTTESGRDSVVRITLKHL